MSTEILRRAASLMRERAEAATNFAWSASAPGEVWRHYDGQVRAVDFPDGFDDSIADVYDNEDAQHIASWHPAVALAVADWLDYEATAYQYNEHAWRAGAADPANRWAERGLTVEANLEHHHSRALTVARAYLGESA